MFNLQGKRDNPDLDKNFKFYTNKIPSKPDGKFRSSCAFICIVPYSTFFSWCKFHGDTSKEIFVILNFVPLLERNTPTVSP